MVPARGFEPGTLGLKSLGQAEAVRVGRYHPTVACIPATPLCNSGLLSKLLSKRSSSGHGGSLGCWLATEARGCHGPHLLCQVLTEELLDDSAPDLGGQTAPGQVEDVIGERQLNEPVLVTR